MHTMGSDDLSRRSLLQAFAATIGAAALPVGWAEIAQAAHETHVAAPPAGEAKHVVPQRGRSGGHRSRRRADHSDRRHARRTRGRCRALHRPGTGDVSLAARQRLSRAARRVSGGVSRSSIPASHRSRRSRPRSRSRTSKTVDHTPFFDTTRLLTLLGMFSLPAYGGNRDGVGWKLIGFEDRHVFQPPFGYYDRDYPGFVVDRAKTP